MLMRGIGRLDAPHRRRAPASIEIMETCFAALDLLHPADQALWGVLCLAFFFLLRRSEIVAITGSSFQWFALKDREVSITDAEGAPTEDPESAAAVHIRLSGSKTNQCGAPTVRMLT
ncbi:hypothetical protein PF005_g31991 [Phytophthora fragariae]|uniref:Tyr recombinase domain-containing protein n=1 Tax=Phytophthora fragariae TaxID=53985 RepID=A0A6A3RLW7_9STRA|nr:hypothetical protein PF009_g25222 [Phytophthora fragariae]KAE8962871.1 hypothetical protein PF011_g29229 [Phytophthora fragariae]KAE9057458.1 hypothetical protein PF007_g31640 [Phytophthora fragariae]KAE9063490.1 hypothetical protein PF010_g28974 [Phytophthora fragariae]KAE9096132.1 hypothetical protein PF006_g23847 [Phytophthora fragariae]